MMPFLLSEMNKNDSEGHRLMELMDSMEYAANGKSENFTLEPTGLVEEKSSWSSCPRELWISSKVESMLATRKDEFLKTTMEVGFHCCISVSIFRNKCSVHKVFSDKV
jgi:hypothetical protein